MIDCLWTIVIQSYRQKAGGCSNRPRRYWKLWSGLSIQSDSSVLVRAIVWTFARSVSVCWLFCPAWLWRTGPFGLMWRESALLTTRRFLVGLRRGTLLVRWRRGTWLGWPCITWLGRPCITGLGWPDVTWLG